MSWVAPLGRPRPRASKVLELMSCGHMITFPLFMSRHRWQVPTPKSSSMPSGERVHSFDASSRGRITAGRSCRGLNGKSCSFGSAFQLADCSRWIKSKPPSHIPDLAESGATPTVLHRGGENDHPFIIYPAAKPGILPGQGREGDPGAAAVATAENRTPGHPATTASSSSSSAL